MSTRAKTGGSRQTFVLVDDQILEIANNRYIPGLEDYFPFVYN